MSQWPTLEGRLNQPLTSRQEAVEQLKKSVPLTPLGEKYLNMNKRVKLKFMVVPELLATMAYVPKPVRVKIIDPKAEFLTQFLGESGRKLVKAGIEFYFTESLAKKLIRKKIAVQV